MFLYGVQDESEQEAYDKIRGQIEQFDRELINSLMVERDVKYNQLYRPDLIEEDTSLERTTILKDSEHHDHRHGQYHVEKKKKPKQIDYDSDEERENSHQMFVNDL